MGIDFDFHFKSNHYKPVGLEEMKEWREIQNDSLQEKQCCFFKKKFFFLVVFTLVKVHHGTFFLLQYFHFNETEIKWYL